MMKPGLSDARVLWSTGRPGEAERIVLRLLEQQESSEALELITRICADDGRMNLALEWCDKAIAVDKLNPLLRFLKASIVQELGDDEGSVRVFKEALYLEPEYVLAHYALASQYRRMGLMKDAMLHFRNALTLLSVYSENEILPGSDDITAGWLSEIIRSVVPGIYPAHTGGGRR